MGTHAAVWFTRTSHRVLSTPLSCSVVKQNVVARCQRSRCVSYDLLIFRCTLYGDKLIAPAM